jgi:hypothetical protein
VRGTGTVTFNGGNVQFTPAGGDILWPRDGGFTMNLNYGALFSGSPDADFNGNLNFNSAGGSVSVTIDGATVDNTPAAAASTWTIAGTGATTWNGTVYKGSTEAVPGSGGPFVSGTVNINRCQGAPVSITAGAGLTISGGTLNAGGTGDPFTDTSTAVHLPITNNAFFNITAGNKHVLSIVGVGTTTVAAGAFLDVGSNGPVTQGNFTVNGMADVGQVNVSGTIGVGAAPASLVARYFGSGTLVIAGGTAQIKNNFGFFGANSLSSVTITSGRLDLTDNSLIVNGGYTQQAGATLAIGLASTTPGAHQLQVTGGLSLDGTLDVSLLYGFTPHPGSLFDILDWGSLAGTFNTLQLPTLTGGLSWNSSRLYTAGILSIGIPGDFNGNGVVDAPDYVVWRKGLGTTYSQYEYNVWRAYFGQTAGSGTGASANAAVPEPATLVMLLLGMLAMCSRRRKATS